MAKAQLKKGDKVSWGSSQGKVAGKVVRKQTRTAKIKRREIKASKSNPQYIVESDKTGARAAHKASSLKKRS